jgi:hypothetical protein
VSSQRDAELMLLCARLCHIQQEESYADEYLDYVELPLALKNKIREDWKKLALH